MQKLYFVRHGQTQLNAANHVQGGAIDSPLLDKSVEDALRTGLILKKTAISHVISSPQMRAYDTASYILSEFDCGSWEGLHIPALAEKYPETFRQFREEPHQYTPLHSVAKHTH